MKLTKLDLACREPAQLARFYSRLLGKTPTEHGPRFFGIDLGGVELFLCPRELAGIPPESGGVQQLHLRCEESFDEIRARARELEAPCKDVEFDPGKPVLCVWDPEGNPTVFLGPTD